MVPEQLLGEVEQLKAEGYSISVSEESNFINLVFEDFVLPQGFNKGKTSLLIRAPVSYPNGKLDMFWVDVDVLLKNGEPPPQSNVIEDHVRRKWRRVSWHPQQWNPGNDNLRTFIEFVQVGLNKAVKGV